MAGVGRTNTTWFLSSTPCLRHQSEARSAIFCGAPAHLIGPGIENTSVPDRMPLMSSHTFGVNSGW